MGAVLYCDKYETDGNSSVAVTFGNSGKYHSGRFYRLYHSALNNTTERTCTVYLFTETYWTYDKTAGTWTGVSSCCIARKKYSAGDDDFIVLVINGKGYSYKVGDIPEATTSTITSGYQGKPIGSTSTAGPLGPFSGNAGLTIKMDDVVFNGQRQGKQYDLSLSPPPVTYTFAKTKYNISYKWNGGNPTQSDYSDYYGKTAITPPSPSKSGETEELTCTFSGNGLVYSATDKQKVNKNFSFDYWNPSIGTIDGDKTYTAYYNSTTESTSFNTPAGPERTGYTFSNWNRRADGTGVAESSGGGVTANTFNSDITLYAIWTPDVCKTNIAYKYLDKNNTYKDLPANILGKDLPESKEISINYGSSYTWTAPTVDKYGFINPKFYRIVDATKEPNVSPNKEISVEKGTNAILIKSEDIYNTNVLYICVYGQTKYSYTLKPGDGKLDVSKQTGDFYNTDSTVYIGGNDLKPTPNDPNSRFVGWVYNNNYYISFEPAEMYKKAPLVFTAEYFPVDTFVKMKDGWHSILHTFVRKNGKWIETNGTISGKNYPFYVYKDGEWHICKVHEV